MSEVSIKFSCECGKAYKVSDRFAGKRVKCKQCGETVTVPSTSSDDIPSQRASSVSQSAIMKSGPVAAVTATEAKTSSRAPAGKPKTKPGSDTVVTEPVDISQKLTAYQRKRDDATNRRGEGRLVLYENDKPTKNFKLDKAGKVLGRAPTCDIVIEHPTVSKEHVRIEYTMGMYIATDASSANGMVVNGKKVRRASLKDNDVIQLGDTILRVDCSR